MKEPLINIITRASRINFFKLCYESIHNQNYSNINHIVTYETPEMYDKLKHYKDITLVKVPHKAKIKGLVVSWNHNIKTDNYLNPDHEFLDYQVLDHYNDHSNNRFVDEHKSVEPSFYKYQVGEVDTHSTGDVTWREYGTHAPYNWYLKIAEKELQDGWVLYVDDDDQLYNNTTLEDLNTKIVDYGSEDVLHLNQFSYPNGDLIPDEGRSFLYEHGFPFVHRQISGVCLCFHTKYADYTYWDEWSSADFRTASSLREKIGKLNMTNLVAIKLTNGTSGGERKDINI